MYNTIRTHGKSVGRSRVDGKELFSYKGDIYKLSESESEMKVAEMFVPIADVVPAFMGLEDPIETLVARMKIMIKEEEQAQQKVRGRGDKYTEGMIHGTLNILETLINEASIIKQEYDTKRSKGPAMP